MYAVGASSPCVETSAHIVSILVASGACMIQDKSLTDRGWDKLTGRRPIKVPIMGAPRTVRLIRDLESCHRDRMKVDLYGDSGLAGEESLSNCVNLVGRAGVNILAPDIGRLVDYDAVMFAPVVHADNFVNGVGIHDVYVHAPSI